MFLCFVHRCPSSFAVYHNFLFTFACLRQRSFRFRGINEETNSVSNSEIVLGFGVFSGFISALTIKKQKTKNKTENGTCYDVNYKR